MSRILSGHRPRNVQHRASDPYRRHRRETLLLTLAASVLAIILGLLLVWWAVSIKDHPVPQRTVEAIAAAFLAAGVIGLGWEVFLHTPVIEEVRSTTVLGNEVVEMGITDIRDENPPDGWVRDAFQNADAIDLLCLWDEVWHAGTGSGAWKREFEEALSRGTVRFRVLLPHRSLTKEIAAKAIGSPEAELIESKVDQLLNFFEGIAAKHSQVVELRYLDFIAPNTFYRFRRCGMIRILPAYNPGVTNCPVILIHADGKLWKRFSDDFRETWNKLSVDQKGEPYGR